MSASAEVFDATAARGGAVIAGRTTYDHSGGWDVALMGSGAIRAALGAGLLDEVIIHQVPILLGGGTPLFQPANKPVSLRLRTVVPAPGVTHLHHEIHT